MSASLEERALDDEIAQLEAQLQAARARRDHLQPHSSTSTAPPNPTNDNAIHPPSTPHALLLLSDSALPLGTFAFSSGLESYLAHHKPPFTTQTTTPPSFQHFLRLSVASVAGTTIPYLVAAYKDPAKIAVWDDEFDAAMVCTVARRASVAQGRALLSVWDRAFRSTSSSLSQSASHETTAATAALSSFSALLKPHPFTPTPNPTFTSTPPTPHAHLPPLFSLLSLTLSLSLPQTLYIYLFSHARAVLSAAVRSSVIGPYQAQGVLASAWLKAEIERGVRGNEGVRCEEAGQRVLVLEIWGGRHEVLYSRIFNS